jgi:hypothetical protein
MKHIAISVALLIFIAIAGLSCATRGGVRTAPRPAQRVVVDLSIFYDSLAPYGRWFAVDEFGWVWTPYDASVGWRPYTHGHWVFTDYGWTWVSRWRWGWAPFHYGRWVHHRRHGWFWVPGRVWGPAWVVWRHRPGRPGWIGWAPMPPQRGWRVGLEFEVESVGEAAVEPFSYSFVEERNFGARDLDRHLELPARNVTLMQDTRDVTDYRVMENRVVNRSLDVEPIERATGRAVTRHRIVDAGSAGGGEQISGGDVRVYRPDISRSMPERAPQPTAPQRPASAEDLIRREDRERRQLEIEQDRSRKALEDRHRTERDRTQRPVDPEQVRRQQEAERRALEEQVRREREALKNRQETRRQTEPPTPTAPPRKPAGEKKPPPQRKPPDNP